MMVLSTNHLVYSELVTPLRDISAFRVAFDLWSYKMQCCNSTPRFEYNSYQYEVVSFESTNNTGTRRTHGILRKKGNSDWVLDTEMKEAIQVLNLPHEILKMITHFVVTIIKAIIEWLKIHYERAVFSSYKLATSSRLKSGIVSVFEVIATECLSLMVWRPDATIDYEKTARQMVKNGEIDMFHRFDLICDYFMEDELRASRDIWFEMLRKHRFQNPTVKYWNSIISDAGVLLNADERWQYSFILNRFGKGSQCHNYACTAFAFDRIPAVFRIPFMRSFVSSKEHYNYEFTKLIKLVISKCSESEQYTLFASSGFTFNVLKTLAFWEAEMENVMKTWLYVSHLVEGSRFIQILREIGRLRNRDPRTYHIHELLVKLWRCSPLSLKKFVYKLSDKFGDNYFLLELCIRPSYIYANMQRREDGIFIEILSDAEPEFRNKLWSHYRDNIVIHSRPGSLKKIMSLCLPKEEIKQVEKIIMAEVVIREHFISLIACGRCSYVDEFLLMFLYGEKQEIGKYKRRLLDGMGDDLSFIVCNCELTDECANELVDFFIDVFAEDADALAEFKVNIISSSVKFVNLINPKMVVHILRVAERLCDEQTLIKVKRAVLQKCEVIAPSLEPNGRSEAGLSLLLMWIFGSAKKVGEFIEL